jgi:hypothetical protein
MEKVHYQLDIVEKVRLHHNFFSHVFVAKIYVRLLHNAIFVQDYFGLQFTDSNNISHWLDPTKLVKKQVKSK